VNEDTQMDLVNSRLEMRAIKNLAAKHMNALSESVDKDLAIIHAYADNELYRLDRLEEDIKEVSRG